MDRTFQRNPSVEAAPLNAEAILFDPTGVKFFMLNRTSSFIWDRLSTPTTEHSLADELCKTFEQAEAPDVLKDVRAILEEMLSMDLVIVNAAS